MKFTIMGEPIPQARHRSFRRNGRNVNYDPLSDVKRVYQAFLLSHPDYSSSIMRNDYFHVSFIFNFPFNKTDSKKLKDKKMSGDLKHTQKPDIDNLEKFFLDVMSGIVFLDDKQVVKLHSEKRWSNIASTEIEISGFSYE
jgi:Holliday junction resolvase RusA-like endonuclease